MVIYSKTLVPTGFDALSVWPFIFMRRRDDQLLVHELVHYREQAWQTPVWFCRYLLSTRFRVAAEVRAHRAQCAAGLSVTTAAHWLVRYDKRMTLADAHLLLAD